MPEWFLPGLLDGLIASIVAAAVVGLFIYLLVLFMKLADEIGEDLAVFGFSLFMVFLLVSGASMAHRASHFKSKPPVEAPQPQ